MKARKSAIPGAIVRQMLQVIMQANLTRSRRIESIRKMQPLSITMARPVSQGMGLELQKPIKSSPSPPIGAHCPSPPHFLMDKDQVEGGVVAYGGAMVVAGPKVRAPMHLQPLWYHQQPPRLQKKASPLAWFCLDRRLPWLVCCSPSLTCPL